jgi:hypothetical protein
VSLFTVEQGNGIATKGTGARASIHAAMQHAVALKRPLEMSKDGKAVVDPRVRI